MGRKKGKILLPPVSTTTHVPLITFHSIGSMEEYLVFAHEYTDILIHTHTRKIIPARNIKFFSNKDLKYLTSTVKKNTGGEMVRKMFILLIAIAGNEESRGGILLWEVLAWLHVV